MRKRSVFKFITIFIITAIIFSSGKKIDLFDRIATGETQFIDEMSKKELQRSYEYKRSLLHLLARFGNRKQIIAALERGVAIDSIDQYGRTPLFYALWGGQKKNVEVLLKKGSNPNHVSLSGTIPLFMISELDFPLQKKMILLLVEYGADIDLTEGGNPPLLSYATMGGNEKLVSFLLEFGANPKISDKTVGLYPAEYSAYITKKYSDISVVKSESIQTQKNIRELFEKYSVTRRSLPNTFGLFGSYIVSILNCYSTSANRAITPADVNKEEYFKFIDNAAGGKDAIITRTGLKQMIKDFDLPIVDIQYIKGDNVAEILTEMEKSEKGYLAVLNLSGQGFCSDYWAAYVGRESDPLVGTTLNLSHPFTIMESLVYTDSDITEAVLFELSENFGN